ncbi:MAG TPA: hypothetical protein VFG80_11750 [Myxococcota bacterium]|nr:hypothetical protein [Myxococcota bacterium]
MTEHRPGSGSSCPRCRNPLSLAGIESGGVWYCSAACAEGRLPSPRRPAVPEPRLYGRPQRFFRPRRPKELRSG